MLILLKRPGGNKAQMPAVIKALQKRRISLNLKMNRYVCRFIGMEIKQQVALKFDGDVCTLIIYPDNIFCVIYSFYFSKILYI